jgi:uncharacterized protein (UPF0335 family)
MDTEHGEGGGRDPELAKMFDLDRSTLVANFVNRMEECLRQAENASNDLKQVVAECNEAEFRKYDIAAMKTVARLRLKDKLEEAAAKLEALERVARLVQFNLFAWRG